MSCFCDVGTMIMKKKNIIILLTVLLLIVAGICYSCSYGDEAQKALLTTTLTNSQGEEGSVTSLAAVTDLTEVPPQRDKSAKELSLDLETINDTQESEEEEPPNDYKKYIYIHLCGAVKHPEVYQVEEGSRLVELIKLAGGLSEEAAGDYINQASLVEDGQRIYIPTRDEIEESEKQGLILGGIMTEAKKDVKADRIEDTRIDINKADATELMTLPGIGQAKASSILEHRNTKGEFKSIEELMNVSGIKEGMFRKISSFIKVE